MNLLQTSSDQKSEYEIKFVRLFENHSEILRVFEDSFRLWCFKNTQKANSLFQELRKNHTKIPNRSAFFGPDVDVALKYLKPSISHAINKALSKKYTLFNEKACKDIECLGQADELKELLVKKFIQESAVDGATETITKLFIAKINGFLNNLKNPIYSPETAGTATLLLGKTVQIQDGISTMQIDRESLEIQAFFAHANTFNTKMFRKISDPLMNFFLDSLDSEVTNMTHTLGITDTQFFQVFRSLIFLQSPSGLQGDNGHDIFRFTEICNLLTLKLFKKTDSETQAKFLSVLRSIITSVSNNEKLHTVSDQILLSSIASLFEENKRRLSSQLQQDKIRSQINHPDNVHSWLSIDDLSLNSDHFQYILGEKGMIQVAINKERFPISEDILNVFCMEDILSTFLSISKGPLLQTKDGLSIDYYDFDPLIEDFYQFLITGTSIHMDYDSLSDIHDRDLSLNTITHTFLANPNFRQKITKYFPEDTETCFWFITKKFFSDIHKQFEKSGIPKRKRITTNTNPPN